MPASFDGKLVVAISSKALFDLEESNRVFEEQGVTAYYRYQLEHENQILAPGIAFALVRKLLRLNTLAPAATFDPNKYKPEIVAAVIEDDRLAVAGP